MPYSNTQKTLKSFSFCPAYGLITLMPVTLKSIRIDIETEVYSLPFKFALLLGLAFRWPQRCTDGSHAVRFVHRLEEQPYVNDLWKVAKE